MRTEQKQQELKTIIGNYCRYYRSKKVCITLAEMSEKTGVKLKTLSNFENGRSSNVYFIITYMKICERPDLQLGFIQGLNKTIDSYNFFIESEGL